ncbi:MAG: hypothetical protein ACI840_002487, partial [Ulvibacter sp.]
MNYAMPTKTSFRNVLFIMSLFLFTTLSAQETATTDSGIFEFESQVIDYGT